MPYYNNGNVGSSQQQDYRTEANIEEKAWEVMSILNNLTMNNTYSIDKVIIAKIIGILSEMEYFLIKYKKDITEFENDKQLIITIGQSSSYVTSETFHAAITRFSEQAGKELNFKVQTFTKPPYMIDIDDMVKNAKSGEQ